MELSNPYLSKNVWVRRPLIILTIPILLPLIFYLMIICPLFCIGDSFKVDVKESWRETRRLFKDFKELW